MGVSAESSRTEVRGLPSGWRVETLGALAEIVSGGTPRTNQSSFWTGSIKWCTPTDITDTDGKYLTETRRSISLDGLNSCGATMLPVGALLLCSRATIGEIKIAGAPLCTNQGFKSLVCRPNVSNEFIYYKLLTMKQQMISRAFGSTFLEISTRNVAGLEFAIPSLAEQRAIAAALSDVDELLAGLDRLIAKKRDLKQAVMQQLLTGESRLAGFRGDWSSTRLNRLADVLKGSALSKANIAEYGTYPCILYGELFTTYGRIISKVVSHTSSALGLFSKAGDVLLPGSTTTTGADLATASALLLDEVALGGDILVLRQRGNSYNPVFLAYLLTHAKKTEIAELTQGITIHHLYGKDLRTLQLRLPSLPEQTAIADCIADMDAELAALAARRDKTHCLKQAMMQELLTGRTRLV